MKNNIKFITFLDDLSSISSEKCNLYVDIENFSATNFILLIKRILILNNKKSFSIFFKNKNWNKENLDLCSFLKKNDNFLLDKFFNRNYIFEICTDEDRQVVRIGKCFKRIYTNGHHV